MDPHANLNEQREIALRIVVGGAYEAEIERLAELVLALDEWRTGGGFDPYGGDAQSTALARLMRDRPEQNVSIMRKPFDLPDGYVMVTFAPSGFTCGIAPDGSVHS